MQCPMICYQLFSVCYSKSLRFFFFVVSSVFRQFSSLMKCLFWIKWNRSRFILFTVTCITCGKTMRSSSLRRHMMDVHLPNQKRQCPICQKLFKTANSLQTHLIVIHRVYKSKYHISDTSYNTNPSLLVNSTI